VISFYNPSKREALEISQSKLARLADVSRFKICVYELGSGKLSEEEHAKVNRALNAEAKRLRTLAGTFMRGAEVSAMAETAPRVSA
jgi:predicted transcriptional regulator